MFFRWSSICPTSSEEVPQYRSFRRLWFPPSNCFPVCNGNIAPMYNMFVFNLLKRIVLNRLSFLRDLLLNARSPGRGPSLAQALNGLRLLYFCSSYPHPAGFSSAFTVRLSHPRWLCPPLSISPLVSLQTGRPDSQSFLGLPGLESDELSPRVVGHL